MACWGRNARKKPEPTTCADCSAPLNGFRGTSTNATSFYVTGERLPLCEDCHTYVEDGPNAHYEHASLHGEEDEA
jgi:hypothetical protein